ncbi:hypothetical protein BO94DRAFT_599249 [Aspergillus sclerotioniger CBS 115572]|uniref:Rhodopsin domain-containing protein n=1 Tax=Aspergillus sclerotioniger CBS 115572 TaxID=1450535 RepID=A0A317WBV4_9EURO|nr:hypothetical protein BO94DRAFT_599249 [Aspergillus sclerotioniger CBS 115572]PWY83833.1 hypothetical protein BO94DRAFT_599249 [Aspergillus sclerotioniger CBS 115572]
MSGLSSEQRQALLVGPAGAPPVGMVSNLVNPPSILATGRGISLVFWIGASICVAIRLYTKACIIKQLRASDYMMLISWALCIGYMVPCWIAGNIAPGVDQWNMTLGDFITLLYYFHVASIIYGICIFFIKASILLQLVEIFGQQRDYFSWSCHLLLWTNLIFYLISLLIEVFSCRPVSKAWDILTPGSCLNTRLVNVVASSVNCISDLIILVLPQTRIWRLHTAFHRKLTVATVFLLGITACASAVVRLAYAVLLFKTTDNISYFSYMAGLWTIPEIACAVITGCLPSLPRFFQTVSMKGRFHANLSVGSWWRRERLPTETWVAKDSRPRDMPGLQGVFPDQYPLTAFASAPGTVDRTTRPPLRSFVHPC